MAYVIPWLSASRTMPSAHLMWHKVFVFLTDKMSDPECWRYTIKTDTWINNSCQTEGCYDNRTNSGKCRIYITTIYQFNLNFDFLEQVQILFFKRGLHLFHFKISKCCFESFSISYKGCFNHKGPDQKEDLFLVPVLPSSDNLILYIVPYTLYLMSCIVVIMYTTLLCIEHSKIIL